MTGSWCQTESSLKSFTWHHGTRPLNSKLMVCSFMPVNGMMGQTWRKLVESRFPPKKNSKIHQFYTCISFSRSCCVRHASFTLAPSNQVHGSGFRGVTPVNGVGETWRNLAKLGERQTPLVVSIQSSSWDWCILVGVDLGGYAGEWSGRNLAKDRFP